MKNVIVKTQDLKKYYKTGNQTVKALDGVDFKVAEREFVSIIGKSGSGKSTLLHMIGGLDTPSSGTVIVDGVNLETLNSEQLALFRRRKVGFIFQQFALMKHYTIFENVEITLIALNIPKKKRKEIVMQSLDMVGIADYWKKLPANLSGGQQQRCAIARALVANKNIILADEPTGALDKMTGQEIMKILKKVNQQGKTVIVVTHDENVAQMGDRIIRIEDGRLV